MKDTNPIILNPPAKINLFLHVGSLREDGYHEIISIFQTIGLRDRLTIQPSQTEDFVLTCSHGAIPAGPDNAIGKAYRAFQDLSPDIPPLYVHLEKHIPAQTGLGGASADAGVFLHYLWRTYSPELPPKKIMEVASQVGSDVPFFILEGTCLVEGRGEKVRAITPLPPLPVLVLHPKVSISTPEAYRGLNPERPQVAVNPIKSAIEQGNISNILENLYNSFEESIFKQYQALSEIYSFCVQEGFPSILLAGSGSNLFILYHRIDRLRCFQRDLQGRFPSLKTTLTYTLSSHKGR